MNSMSCLSEVTSTVFGNGFTAPSCVISTHFRVSYNVHLIISRWTPTFHARQKNLTGFPAGIEPTTSRMIRERSTNRATGAMSSLHA